MKKIIRASVFVGGFLVVMITTADLVFAGVKVTKSTKAISNNGRAINDSLVQNLSCQNLSVDSIYRAIRDDAFSEARNMDVENWDGNCWGLSSTQRMFSYLARYRQSNNMSFEARRELVMNQVRRGVPTGSSSTRPLTSYSVFPVEGNSVVDSYDFWWGLRSGYYMNLSKRTTLQRTFRDEIPVNQSSHFYRAKNLGMGLGSGSTNSSENYESLKTLMRNATGKRLTLVNLRMSRFNQHIVRVKSYTKLGNGDVVFKVYDSNQPKVDQDLTYESRTGAFTSRGIVKTYGIPVKPMGLFIVDEEERADFEVAMLKYYRAACK